MNGTSADGVTPSLDLLKVAIAARYRVEREIGSGGMATVYLAEDLRHHRKVAVKVLRPELSATLGPERFLREIEVAARLQHPHILPLLDSGNDGGFLYYVMPYVEGPSLRERLATHGALPVQDAVRTLAEVVDALAEAHRCHIVHRDVKPDNVLLAGRHAVVADFGIAKAVSAAAPHQKVTTVGVALGTPTYMAPEQVSADPHIDHRADIYAVGVMAYEMLTGSPPFTGSSGPAVLAAHMAAEPKPLRAQQPTIPQKLEDVVLRCLAKDPSGRWQSAEELLAELETLQTPSGEATPLPSMALSLLSKVARNPRVVVPAALALVALTAAAVWSWRRDIQSRWAREMIPRIEKHADAGEWEAAYALARRVQKASPRNAALAELWPRFSWLITIPTDPAGAKVFRRGYSATEDRWDELGSTPLEAIRFPFGYSLVRFESRGRPPLLRAMGFAVEGSQELMRLDTIKLDSAKELPPGMVRVPARRPESRQFRGPSANALFRDFFLGRYEVTNREYKEFVAGGGYQRREFWEHPFVLNGRSIPWENAMALLTDKTGRPGPSTWETSDYPAGQGNHPVGGVSWYEAAAFARFVGKELPTVHLWRHAFDRAAVSWLWLASNVGTEGPAAVGQFQGISWPGTFDMAGNVREWCFNATGEKRFILGGTWGDEAAFYATDITELAALPPFDRSPTNGFRLAITHHSDSAAAAALRLPVPEAARRNVANERPVSPEAFEIYRSMYAYDPIPLEAKLEATDSTADWIRERVTFDAAYGGERMSVYVYLPRNGSPPHQTVVYYPGAVALFLDSIEQYRTIHVDFMLKSGRAVAFPVYKGTFERRVPAPVGPAGRRQRRIQVTNELRRTVDYLATRKDIDIGRLGYFGYSAGGARGPIFLVMEPRLRAAVFYMAGIDAARQLPEVEPVVFLPRVRVPVLLLSGQLDFDFVLETSAKPFFQLLGTPAQHKRHVVAEGGHFVPRTILIRETLDWLDQYLGPVK